MKNNSTNELKCTVDSAEEQMYELREKELSHIKDRTS